MFVLEVTEAQSRKRMIGGVSRVCVDVPNQQKSGTQIFRTKLSFGPVFHKLAIPQFLSELGEILTD